MTCLIGGEAAIELLIDSGAEVNVLTETDWSTIKASGGQVYDVDTNPSLSVRSYASTASLEIACTFKAWITATLKPETFAEFVVVRGGSRSLLGRHTALGIRLLAIGMEVNQVSAQPGPNKFPAIPDVEIEFDIDESVHPVRHAYVSIPAHFRKGATDRLKAMEQSGIIEPVIKAPRWISGISAVPKGKGDFRLVINMRGPNKAIQRQFHQMPRVEEIKTKLNGAKFFTKLDLQSAFHHVRLGEKSREMMTFMAPTGMYRFKRMAFGVNCAPEIFQRVMERILGGIPNVIVYIDDILIYVSTIDHLRELTNFVLAALENNNLTLNHGKCEFEKESLKFLGHQPTAQGLNIDEQKVADVAKFREPESASELKSFLGLASYVSAYIPHFADVTEPLWRVANKNAFTWETEQAEAFKRVKSAIMTT